MADREFGAIPLIGGGDIIKAFATQIGVAPTAYLDTASSGGDGINLAQYIVSIPQVYGEAEDTPYRVRAYTQEQAIAGDVPAIAGLIKVTETTNWLAMHAKLVETQVTNGYVGYDWFVKSKNITYRFWATIADFPIAPEGETGELDGEGLSEYKFTGKGETQPQRGNVFDTP